MLNRKQYLLLCLAEELGEVQKEVIKCLRFGLHNSPGEGLQTNFERLQDEWSELIGVIMLLEKDGVVIEEVAQLVDAKIKRTEQYYQFAQTLDQVE